MKNNELTSFDKYTKIILDTNILNHIFTEQINDGEKMVKLLQNYQEQLWIPFTVYKEFSQLDFDKFIENKKNEFKKISGSLRNEYDVYKHKVEAISGDAKSKGFFDWNNFIQSFLAQSNNFFDAKKGEMEKIAEADYIGKVTNLINEVKKLLENLIQKGQIGKEFTFKEMMDIAEEGSKRYSILLPPGYSDNGKKGIDKYNDLFIWKEIIQYVNESGGGSFVFITDDFKEGNWWETLQGKTKVPSRMLMKEFKEACPDDYENKFSAELTFKSLSEFLKENEKIFGKISSISDKEKIKDLLLNMFKDEISDELESYVFNIEPTEIDDSYFLPNNDGEIMQEDFEVESFDVDNDEETISCKILINQCFEVIYAYEDNEGDRYKMGECEILVYATVTISGDIDDILGNDFMLLDKSNYTIDIDHISYSVISNSNIFEQ